MFKKLITGLFILLSGIGSANAWNIPGSRYDDNYRTSRMYEIARAMKGTSVYWDTTCAGLYGYVWSIVSPNGINHVFDYSYYNAKSVSQQGYNSPLSYQFISDGFITTDASYCISPNKGSYLKSPLPY